MDQANPLVKSDISQTEAFETFSRSTVSMVLSNPNLPDNPLVYVNEAFETLTGYSSAAAIGQNCRFLQGEGTDPDDVARLRRAIKKAEDLNIDIQNYRADGTPFINRLLITPIFDTEGTLSYFLGIQKSLSDDESLVRHGTTEKALREIQHRVKNHLSMIVGMIRMQARGSDAVAEYKSLSRRIESLQLLYEELTETGNRSAKTIPVAAYLSRVCNAIAHLDGRAGIRVNMMADEIEMPIDAATRIGLIVSEVLTNALQHAFVDRDTGCVEVRISAVGDGGLRAIIADDGVGMPDGVNWPETNSLGGRIVMGLIDGLGGTFDVTRAANGTVITLDVPAIQDNSQED